MSGDRKRMARCSPPRSPFVCRRCHELTYESCQEHDKRVDALRRNPDLISAFIDNHGSQSPGKLILALKVLGPLP
jgi:hypothetical protein